MGTCEEKEREMVYEMIPFWLVPQGLAKRKLEKRRSKAILSYAKVAFSPTPSLL